MPAEMHIITDHRMRHDQAMRIHITRAELFADRSFVEEGCECDYCQWDPDAD